MLSYLLKTLFHIFKHISFSVAETRKKVKADKKVDFIQTEQQRNQKRLEHCLF